MRNYIIRRLLQIIPVFIGILFILFFILEQAPGGPIGNLVDPNMTPEQKEELAEKLGLNQPFYVKFVNWVKEAANGNLGYSIQKKRPVTLVIQDYLPPTLMLGLYSLIITLLIGIPAGIISATRQYTRLDNALTVVSLIGISMPTMFFGLILLKLFAIDIKLFPLFGLRTPMMVDPSFFTRFFDIVHHLTLPAIVLGLSSTASFMRYTRSSMLEVIRQDYIRTARAKGLKERVVIYRHAFRNALIPIITLLGMQIPALFSGALVTESIFGLPGVGRLASEAALYRDYPVILAVNALLAFLTLISTLIADIMYAVADPRVKYE
ncbi:ABC transporter permease [Eubacteriales bacterium OttesenSCG-928-N14]|nr:ABC transporter permease [Eubacteriales bacterium OttesenSCG-928-N14]